MILEALCTPIFLIIDFFLSLIPTGVQLPSWSTDFINVITIGLSFFPNDVFVVAVANITIWSGVYLIDSIAVFVLRKIPFINIS